jgi:Carboxypeptidase regulatory-like domain
MPCLEWMKRILKFSKVCTEILWPRTPRAVRRGLSAGLIVAVAIIAMNSRQGEAQTAATGAISGIVTDATGALVAKAKITVTSESTGDSRTGTSTSNGSFIVPVLPPGSYTVRALPRMVLRSSFKRE